MTENLKETIIIITILLLSIAYSVGAVADTGQPTTETAGTSITEDGTDIDQHYLSHSPSVSSLASSSED